MNIDSDIKRIMEISIENAKVRTQEPNGTYLPDGCHIGEDGIAYCNTCGEPRQIRVDLGGGELLMPCICRCREEKEKAEREALLRYERERQSERCAEECFPYPRMRDFRFDMDDKKNPDISDKLYRYCVHFEHYRETGGGIILCGPCGTGKTFLACCIANDLLQRGYRAKFTSFSRIVSDTTPGVYASGRNYTAYTIEQTGADVDFALWDESSVQRLIKEQPQLMPYYPKEKAVKRGIDLAWSKRQITALTTSGLLCGESIGKVADRLQGGITDMNRASALRAARTAITGAENAGRQDAYQQAAAVGIKARKRWVATKDERTRTSHADLDGEIVDYDKPFSNGLMYPGDPGGPAREVYNCRCTMAYAEKPGIEAEPRMMRVRNPVTGRNEVVPDMNYREWEEWKKSSMELKNSAGERIVKVKSTTLQAEPNSITQKQSTKGGIDRNFYGPNGRQVKQISNNCHGHKSEEHFGNHGEHAHDYSCGADGRVIRSRARELTIQERRDNGDFIDD